VFTRKTIYLLLALVLSFLLYLVNPWVYSFKPVYTYVIDITSGKRIVLFEAECIGFIPLTTMYENIRITPGEFLCYSEEGQGVYESLRVSLNITPGLWTYRDVALLYINTLRSRYIDIVVEKPLENTNLTIIISNSRDHSLLVAFNASEYKRLRIEVPAGLNTYTITLILKATRPIKEAFRIGFYIGSGD
jgi:hypothetical protein